MLQADRYSSAWFRNNPDKAGQTWKSALRSAGVPTCCIAGFQAGTARDATVRVEKLHALESIDQIGSRFSHKELDTFSCMLE